MVEIAADDHRTIQRPRQFPGPLGLVGNALTAAWLLGFTWYCWVLMSPVPLHDDWAYIATLLDHLEGKTSLLEYLTRLHNGHPSVPGRLLFLMSYHTDGLRLDVLRLVSALLFVLSAACLFLVVGPARGPGRERTSSRIFYYFPCLTLVVSLGHWEIFSWASGVSNAAVLLFSIVAIVCTGDGLRRGSAPRLFLGAIAAVAATCSMSHGCLTWLAMAWQAAVARRPRPWLGAVAAIIGVTCIAILANSSQSGAPLQVEPIITALLIAIGTGLVGLVHNQPVPNLNLAAGALVAALASAAAFSLSKMDPDVRDRVNESSGLMLLGALSATALAFGRGAFGPDYMASSRYAAIVMPLAAGVYLFWLARPHRGFKLALPLATALVLAGEGLTNYEEAQMAPHRAHYLAETAHVFRCAPTDSPAALARTIVDMRDDYLVGRPFLESGRLSIYGLPFACDVP